MTCWYSSKTTVKKTQLAHRDTPSGDIPTAIYCKDPSPSMAEVLPDPIQCSVTALAIAAKPKTKQKAIWPNECVLLLQLAVANTAACMISTEHKQ